MNGMMVMAMAAAAAASVMAASTSAAQDRFDRHGLYVAASDLTESTAFYSSLLDRRPTMQLPEFVAFDVAGGLFAVVDRDAFGLSGSPGATVSPYISVRDVEGEFSRVRQIMPDRILPPGLISEGPIRLFKISAPDGVVVEFYQLGAAPDAP